MLYVLYLYEYKTKNKYYTYCTCTYEHMSEYKMFNSLRIFVTFKRNNVF